MTETTDNIVKFDGETVLDVTPESVLEGAIEEGLSDVLIVGHTKDGDFYLASSVADSGALMWSLEKAKHQLLHAEGS